MTIVAASNATIVLPLPTSPSSRRFMGKGFSRSAAISASTRFCAVVGLKGRIRFTAARTFSSRTRMAMPRREVRVEQGFAARGEAIAFENLRRERFRNIAVEIGEHAVDDAAQHARADGADGFVDGDDAADFGGIGGATFAGAYEFHLGVDHFQAARAVTVFVHFSVQDEFLAVLQFSFKIAAVEETDVDRAGCIADRDVEN